MISSGAGEAIYGFEDIVVACEAFPAAVLVICTYKSLDTEYMARLRALTAERANVIFEHDLSEAEFDRLLESCDIYVRATDRDGDSVALREARDKGLRLIASDVVARLPEARLYPGGDRIALRAALATQLGQFERCVPEEGGDRLRTRLRASFLKLYGVSLSNE